MKQVINNLIYDTEAAEEIGHCGTSNPTDFNYFSAKLYRTPRGRYFLAGEGGPSSVFSRPVDQNSWSGGSGIIALDPMEALRYAENHLSASVIEQYFSDYLEEA
jgi:hypothetical protein